MRVASPDLRCVSVANPDLFAAEPDQSDPNLQVQNYSIRTLVGF